ncbi:MAG: GTPase Era involved in 16S rRNA processing [Flavobacteriales bacterium]|jgi:GTPase Era involved in 16S rRNA processing
MSKLSYPRFAVVGHPNKGKSSIVSTLVHHDEIQISELSGTTRVSSGYPYKLDGNTLYELFDTPGFQRPRQVLGWLEEAAGDASTRIAAVSQFIQQHESTANFVDEVELLKPIISDGAGIIYVVDGSVPYSPEYEAEMTILQWTGQPRMALINPIGGADYVEQWEQALGQYFSLVRVFNPMTADTEKQLSILTAFSELNPSWQASLQATIGSIQSEAQRIRERVAYKIFETLAELIALQESLPVLNDRLKNITEEKVKLAYQTALVGGEKRLRKQIINLYSLNRLQCEELELKADYPDLFDQDYWYLFGLSRQKLISLSAAAGFAAGAIVDAGVGGASFMAGALIGGIVSGAASLIASQKPDKLTFKGIPLGGKRATAGPIKNLQLAFVLFGRAIEYQRAVAKRAHADRSILHVQSESTDHWIECLSKAEQFQLTRLIHKAAKGLSLKNLNDGKSLLLKALY